MPLQYGLEVLRDVAPSSLKSKEQSTSCVGDQCDSYMTCRDRESETVATSMKRPAGNPSQISDLGHLFRRHVKPKKQHEIKLLGEV